MSAATERHVPQEATAALPAVIVVGSLHYDIVVDAPDRPRKGETIAGSGWHPKFGGKGGNQAAAARRQGIPTAMVGAVGDDSFGIALLAGLDRAQVDRTNVAVLSGIGSGMSVAIFDDDGDYGAVIVSGANLAIAPGQVGNELLLQGKIFLFSKTKSPKPSIKPSPVMLGTWDYRQFSMPRQPAPSRATFPIWSTFWSSTPSKPR